MAEKKNAKHGSKTFTPRDAKRQATLHCKISGSVKKWLKGQVKKTRMSMGEQVDNLVRAEQIRLKEEA